ncbi:MAG TPA: VOC family protein [Chthonomonadaceae bacterium]|nr:VOC family protein [Chthonomonadaceae bacterium]
MNTGIRLGAGQFALVISFSALAGAAIAIGMAGLRPAAAIAATKSADPAAAAVLGSSAGVGRANAPAACPVVHFDIGCKDSGKTKEFYSQLFDWKIKQQGPAGVIDTGSKEGIQGHITSLGHEPEHYVTFYVQVSDIQAYLDKAGKLGGKTLVPAVKIPTGQFAWIADPDGNIVGLLQQKAPDGK